MKPTPENENAESQVAALTEKVAELAAAHEHILQRLGEKHMEYCAGCGGGQSCWIKGLATALRMDLDDTARILAKLIAQERARVLTEIQHFAKKTADEYAEDNIVAWNACDDIRLECQVRAAAERREAEGE